MIEIPAWAATLLACLIAALVLLYVHRVNARRAACIKLREAFAPALARLEAGRRFKSAHDAPEVDQFLIGRFEIHAAAKVEFSPFVGKGMGSSYEKAWEQYCEHASPGRSSALFMASTIDEDNPWGVIERLIHDILFFAKT